MQEPYSRTGFVRLCWEKLFCLIVLNILFLVCCVPVLTIPGAVTALSCACQGALLEEPHLLRRFFRSFRANFTPSIPLGLLLLVGPMALGYGCVFYYQSAQGQGFLMALSIFCFVWVFLAFCMGVFAFQMLARVNLKVGAAVRNAFYLTFWQAKAVFGWMLLSFGLMAVIWLLFPYSLPWILLLGGSLPCFAAARGVLPVIDTMIVKEETV